MYWFAQAPANIALIKYMGKSDSNQNLPDNASLSYTLNNLLSFVKLEQISGKDDFWESLDVPGVNTVNLSQAAQQRFLKHLAFLKEHFQYQGSFIVRSANNFPMGSGLASSASSFAALTKCVCLALSELTGQAMPDTAEQAQLSRQGSGSSCRSFYSPWAMWKGDTVEAIELPYDELIHQVIVISHDEKAVSSSLAHQRVKSSPDYPARAERAEHNLKALLDAFQDKDWTAAYKICWREFQDMHKLFSTSAEPFSYMTEPTLDALKALQLLWEQKGDGPLVTMDAGPNIHLLYRPDQKEMASQFRQDYLINNYDVL